MRNDISSALIGPLFSHISTISTTGIKETGYTFGGGNLSKKNLPPSEKGSTLKGKNLLPTGANSFLLV